MKNTKEYYGFYDHEELLATSTDRESRTIELINTENSESFGVTINPLLHKRIAHKIPGQKSECKKWMNYTNSEQREILKDILEPFMKLVDGDIFEEETEEKNIHLHTTFKVSDLDYKQVKADILNLNQRLGDKKGSYTAFDFKFLMDDEDCARWRNYAKKNGKPLA